MKTKLLAIGLLSAAMASTVVLADTAPNTTNDPNMQGNTAAPTATQPGVSGSATMPAQQGAANTQGPQGPQGQATTQ